MLTIQTTSVSSKGQIVIPTIIRKNMGITFGAKLAIFTDGKNLLLSPIEMPTKDVFKELISESRKIAKKNKLKKSDLRHLIKDIRNENRS